jgi:heme-degrading monooxygenase HmoA
MIVRVWRCRLKPGAVGLFERFAREDALPILKGHEGCVTAVVGVDDYGTGLVVTIWRDLNALKKFAGDNWAEPVIHPNEADLLAEKPEVTHYSLVAMKT